MKTGLLESRAWQRQIPPQPRTRLSLSKATLMEMGSQTDGIRHPRKLPAARGGTGNKWVNRGSSAVNVKVTLKQVGLICSRYKSFAQIHNTKTGHYEKNRKN